MMSNLFWLTAAQMARRRPGTQRGRLIGRTNGGMNTKLHAVADACGRPIRFFMTAGQVSDDTGAAALPGSLPKAGFPLADRGDDARTSPDPQPPDGSGDAPPADAVGQEEMAQTRRSEPPAGNHRRG